MDELVLLGVRVRKVYKKELKILAAKEGCSIQDLIDSIIERLLKEKGVK